jgi:uncharacterized protein YndB with AHSA1/START domain
VPAPQGETSVVERAIRVEAAPQAVFEFFTDPERLVRWMGVGATLDPRPGGIFRLNTVGDFFVEGRFVVVEPPRRIVFTWGFGNVPDDEGNPFPPGSSTVEVEFLPDADATIVRLTHRVPKQLAHFHAMGWENYLGRLATAVTGEDPGPDPFQEFVEAMAAADD